MVSPDKEKESAMPQARAQVRSHTKVSSSGKKFTVRQHARRVTVADLIERARKGGVKSQVTAGAVGASATLALWWSLNAVFSVIAALMVAITLVMLSVVGLAVQTVRTKRKPRKKQKAFRKLRGVLSPKRRMKLWVHSRRKKLAKRVSGYILGSKSRSSKFRGRKRSSW